MVKNRVTLLLMLFVHCSFTMHTGAGLIVPQIQDDGQVESYHLSFEIHEKVFFFFFNSLFWYLIQVKVDMGEPILRAEDVPTRLVGNRGESVVAAELVVDGVSWIVTCVSMGNPHCITFGTKDGQVRRLLTVVQTYKKRRTLCM